LFEKCCHTFYKHKKEYVGFPPNKYRMEDSTTRAPYFLEKGTFSTVLKVAYAMGFK
jgi:hypothetical protein